MSIYPTEKDMRDGLPLDEKRSTKELVNEIILEFAKPQMHPKDYLDQFDFFETSKAMAREILELRVACYQEGSPWKFWENHDKST